MLAPYISISIPGDSQALVEPPLSAKQVAFPRPQMDAHDLAEAVVDEKMRDLELSAVII